MFFALSDKILQIRSDYRDIHEKFFGEIHSFDAPMADLKELEDRINP